MTNLIPNQRRLVAMHADLMKVHDIIIMPPHAKHAYYKILMQIPGMLFVIVSIGLPMPILHAFLTYIQEEVELSV